MSNLRSKQKVVEPTSGVSPMSTHVSPNALRVLKEEITESFAALLKSFEDRILQRFSDITADIANLRLEMQATKTKLVAVTKRCECAEFDLQKLRGTVGALENDKVATDVVVLNVPNEGDAAVIVNKIFGALSWDDVRVRSVFRTYKSNDKSKSVPIIAKLSSADERVKIFKALAAYRKSKKKQLALNDVGLAGDTNIVVHECLTSLNRDILRAGLHYKKTNLIEAAFSLRGYVFVRVKPNSIALKVSSIDELNKVVGGAK